MRIYQSKDKLNIRTLLKISGKEKSTWGKKKQDEFIELVKLGVYLNPLYFLEDKYGKLSVLDGKSRLHSIHNFSLKGFSDLTPKSQTAFLDYTFDVVIFKPQNKKDLIIKIQKRLNNEY